MPDSLQRHPSAFISWAHVDPDWSQREIDARRELVFNFATALRGNGVDADVDLYYLTDPVDWTRWGPSRVDECEFVLIVVSNSWRLAWEGGGDSSKGAGAAAEADSLRSIYAADRKVFIEKVRLILLPGANSEDIPSGLHGVPRFRIETIDEAGLSDLLRSLTKQPEFMKNALGPLPELPPNPPAFAGASYAAAPTNSVDADETVAPPMSDVSPGQRNALAKAREYLRYTAFSRSGLLNQLASEGFSMDDAEFAVASAGAAWDEQAAKKAGQYLAHIALSREGLLNQLVSEGFSESESERALANIRADWTEQAVKKAKEYLVQGAFSQSRLSSQLVFDGFTENEATAAAADTYQ
ncbi:Ltp family lipoprotein [Subtercola boreus]|uniref:Uncharacterized protein n=1 Tax=Subtercola boreus TaxID=120213 RepID=A0A3E0WEL9_9MICO|nr:Ltp family lipoprotein [Subtercola boreus]RFA23672.1 hypothetical protein B7R24_02040 [Subtercola boreus]RFA24066.1 hypothetical protein B7R23_02040 [Subtercola boreus]RFA29764.1 hypothetical protein B7R25_02035 [Subtercola boreus]